MEKTVTVQFVNPPRGNSKSHSIKTTDGEYIGFFADKLAISQGQTYRLLVEEHQYNGKTYLNATRVIDHVIPQRQLAGAVAPSPERWWMPFVSNTVAHALQSGQITDPMHVKIWAAAAKQAALEIDREGVGAPFKPALNAQQEQPDDDIPY